jgi:hypothetical protein
MSQFKVVSITVSCEIANKTYGNGDSRMVSMTARVPEDEGLDLSDAVTNDAIDLYFESWNAAMQTRLMEGAISGDDFQLAVAKFLERLGRVKQLYSNIKGMSAGELKNLIAEIKAKKEKA